MRGKTKAALFNTSLLESKVTKNTGGVQVITLTKKDKLETVQKPEELETEDIEYYRIRKIPSTGHFMR